MTTGTVAEQNKKTVLAFYKEAHWTGLVSENGDVGVDLFRVENGKLVEHWDVFAPVPTTSKNSNTAY